MHSTAKNATKRDVLKLAKERDVRFVRLVFADILGVSKNVSIPASELEAALDGNVTFDGGSIDGFVRGEELDMQLRPDPSTFALYPWNAGDGAEARLICDIAMPDGSPFEGCPRTHASARQAASALVPSRSATEIEFYLFDAQTGGGFDRPRPATSARTSTSAPTIGRRRPVTQIVAGRPGDERPVASAPPRTQQPARRSTSPRWMRSPPPHHVPPCAPSPNTSPHRFELEATFTPKPSEDRAGSGLHVELRSPPPPRTTPSSTRSADA